MKKYLSLGAVLALTLVLAACGGSSSGGSSSGGGSDTGSSEPIQKLTWASLPAPRADAVTSFSHPTYKTISPVVQGLMSYDDTGKVIPGLADLVDNPNPTTYVYQLESGVKFSDGKPLTIEDVIYSLERNLGEDSQSASNFANVASMKAMGDDKVVFKLKEPDVGFVNIPAFCGQIIEKAAAIAGGEDKIGTPANLPVGTGPYKFTSFRPEVGATYEVNPYWTGDKPAVQQVEMKYLNDDSALALAMRSGEIDGAFEATSQKGFNFPGVEIVPSLGVSQIALSMNTAYPPFDDLHLRRAIAYATDREGMAQAIFDGAAEVHETLTPASVYSNVAPSDQVNEMFEGLPPFEFDLDKAKAELAKSKYPDGLSITFMTEPVTLKVAQILQPSLAKIGIDMEIEEKATEAAYLEVIFGPRDKLGLTTNFYGSTYPEPSSLMGFFLSPDEAKVNGLNSANYTNPEVGRLLKQQNKTADGAKRLEQIGQIFKLVQEEVPYVPLFTPELFMVISDDYVYPEFSQWTSGFTPWPLDVKRAS